MMAVGTGRRSYFIPTYLHFKEGAAKRGPAVHRLQEGHFSLLDGHRGLLVVGGDDELRTPHRHKRVMRLCTSVCAALNEVNHLPPAACRQSLTQLSNSPLSGIRLILFWGRMGRGHEKDAAGCIL